jgi:photosystem II stability/assembly factor-like uncharacterized protein
MRPILLALIASAVAVFPARAGDLRNFDDAALHAVQMIDAMEGWAVGDEGVVWHTTDGGKHWDRQPTGTRASLRSLHFLNPYVGWVAGREELPGGGSAGVLLFTRDGGIKWQRATPNVLPGLNHVRFADPQNGILVGDGTDQHPTGAFLTGDAGRTWQPVPGPRGTTWLAADFAPGQKSTAVLASAWGRLRLLRDGKMVRVDHDPLGPRALRAVRFLPPARKGEVSQEIIAVGQGGLVLMTDVKTGAEAGYADLKLPAEVLAAWDFHAVACSGRHVWVAGRPGSVVLHSADRGNTWEVQRTDEPLALNGLCFLDEKKGWAVGELGSILATDDGGKSWAVQRRSGVRAAVLLIHARGAGTPVDAVAWLGGEQGYLTAAVRVVSADPESAPPAKASEALRYAAALRQAGGAAGEMLWQFPLPEYRLRSEAPALLKGWDQLHAGRAADELLRQMVLALRIWRPDVVLADHPDPQTHGQTADALVAEAVHVAFQQAADPKAFPEQLTQLGLKPWKPAKLYGRWEETTGAHVALDVAEPCPRLRASPRDFAAPAAGLLSDMAVSLPAQRYFRLLDSRIAGADAHQDLMQGVALAHGGMARRALEAAELPDAVRKSLQARRNLEALAESFLAPKAEGADKLIDGDRLLAQVGPALDGLPPDMAAPAAYAVAQQYVRAGQWALAREVLLMLVDRYPAHPLAADACRWLIRYHASSEARRRHELGQFAVISEMRFQATQTPARPPKPDKPMPKADADRPGAADPKRDPNRPVKYQAQPPELDASFRQTSQLVPIGNHGEPRPVTTQFTEDGRAKLQLEANPVQRWYRGGLDLEPRLAALGPLFACDPAIQFSLQSARRCLGDFETPRQWLAHFLARQPAGPWRSAAEAEFWLTNRTGEPPKPVLWCKRLETRPFLDGNLDEDCWKVVKPVRLRNAVGKTVKEGKDDKVEEEYPTEVRLAFDKDFLYLACRCTHPQGRSVEPVKNRTRDADLRGFDRISLLLDLDRDYGSYYHLQVDQRGCVCEDCWGDTSWNPRWFVAVKREADYWQVEAAIPLHELTGERITSGKAWACNVVRVLPGRGVQAFSTPADVQPRPEGMGLLIFTHDPERTAAAPLPPMGKVP